MGTNAKINSGFAIALLIFIFGINVGNNYAVSLGALLIGIFFLRFNRHIVDEFITHGQRFSKNIPFLYRAYSSPTFKTFQTILGYIMGAGFTLLGVSGLIIPFIQNAF